ncbi:MAG: hypothetical protein KQ78_00819 [Candidatus Izimaplasma bacterium HR2]|nr:MAG: hypothetical protein KQ78_00819 [Candidatus Izimaplasma bacterium HR2]
MSNRRSIITHGSRSGTQTRVVSGDRVTSGDRRRVNDGLTRGQSTIVTSPGKPANAPKRPKVKK